jgi:hypothetical protein
MFSFISQLIGCAQAVPLSGPDFSQPMEKVIHVGHKVSVFYHMPGNFSKELNFDKIYQNTLTWRTYESIDMGNWDYWGKKSEGPGGQLGGLRIGIGYSLLPKGVNLIQHIKQSYENYLNGEKGLNQKYHFDEMNRPVSTEEYAERAIIPPSLFETTSVGGAEFITWKTDREFDGFKNRPYIYYILPVGQEGYLTFLFRSSISVLTDEMIVTQRQRIQRDINQFLSNISVEQH